MGMNVKLSSFAKRIDSTYQAIILYFLDMDIGIKELRFKKPSKNCYLEITIDESGIGVIDYFNF
jgi:predicted RNA-binding protein